ncbi:MAG TPA: hypothetical protein VEF04_21100, partial [Blastocatellia bacterium]|nr:hypothetical protein [Blastocatellia bacterium]
SPGPESANKVQVKHQCKDYMDKHLNQSEGRLNINCHKCSAGCIHLEYGNLMLTFSQEQFLAFSEVISKTRLLLLQERQTESIELFSETQALVM